jgi:hypothetical protein
MAIGDTVQAGLLKADFSPIERGGVAKGRAYSAIGEGIGSALDKFAKNKQEGEAAEMGINAMIAGMDDQQKEELLSGDSEFSKTYDKFLDGDLTNSQKKTFLGGLVIFNTAQRQNMADQMAKDKFAIEQAEADRDAIRFKRDQQAKISENQFLQTLPSQITDPELQRQADIVRPGLPALGNADARNRFMQSELDDPRNQVPVMNLNDRDFLNQFKDDPQQIKRALAFIEDRKAKQPKPMTPEQYATLTGKILDNKQKSRNLKLPVLSKGEQVIDALTAEEYTKYVNLGGKSAVQSKIKKLNKAIEDLEGSDDLNSWLTGVLPESMKALFNEKGLSVQQAVESVIQGNLRETLGAAFAQKEGEMFLARGYDARLSDEDNIERVKSLLKEIEDRANARTQTFDYFKKNKTMQGYDGPVFNESSQPSPSSSFDPQEIDRLYEEKMRLGKARGLR